MPKQFKVKKKNLAAGKVLRRFVRIFKRKPKRFINLNESQAFDGRDLPKPCILIGNHNGAGGPFSFRVFVKHQFMTWGAYQMCEGFKSRQKYLYHTFYRQKLGWGKVRAAIMSVIFGVISKFVYSYAGMIPTYTDGRFKSTLSYSMQCLNEGVSVMVYPEDSTDGYKEKIEKFYGGFLSLAKIYFKRTGIDLPIYTCYYCKKPKTIIIGKPMYAQELLKDRTDEEAVEIFREYMNELGEQ